MRYAGTKNERPVVLTSCHSFVEVMCYYLDVRLEEQSSANATYFTKVAIIVPSSSCRWAFLMGDLLMHCS